MTFRPYLAVRGMSDFCECGHDRDKHWRRRYRCWTTDSYGMRCTCPAFELWRDDDPDPWWVDDGAGIWRAGPPRPGDGR